MTEKKTSDIQEAEIHQIEQDFKNIIGEMTDIANIREFTDIYRQLHSLLMDSHEKNKLLTSTAQQLNSQIITNATKISSLLKMSEDDHKCIEQYKDEFSKAWKLVTVSQEKEIKAKEICESLKNEVDRLAGLVHEQSVSEANYADIKLDMEKYADEAKQNIQEIEVLHSEIEKYTGMMIEFQNETEFSKAEYNNLTQEISKESDTVSTLQNAKSKLYDQIEITKNSQNEMEAHISENSHSILKGRKNVENLSYKVSDLQALTIEYKNEFNTTLRSRKEKQGIMDRAAITTNGTELKLKKAKAEYERRSNEHKNLIAQTEELDKMIEESTEELEEIKMESVELKQAIKYAYEDRKRASDMIVSLVGSLNASDAAIHAANRGISSQVRSIQTVNNNLRDERFTTEEVVGMVGTVENGLKTEKLGLQISNTSASALEKEAKETSKKTSDLMMQISRYRDAARLTRAENESSKLNLENITKQNAEHQEAVKAMRAERDAASGKIAEAERANDELRADIGSLEESLRSLKKEVQAATRRCIDVHFQSRAVEKQTASLIQTVALTKAMCAEAQSSIAGFKGEHEKLRVIHSEAEKDIAHAKQELTATADVVRLLRGQIAKREEQIEVERGRAYTLECEIRRRAGQFRDQTAALSKLEGEANKAVRKQYWLRDRADTESAVRMEKVTLETALLREQEYRARLENELMRPLNVHRWTFIAAMQPEVYKQIQMIMYLKSKLEEVGREKERLDAAKSKIERAIRAGNTRLKNCRIVDGKVAIQNVKDALKAKDAEMNDMEKEASIAKEEVESIRNAISDIRERIKATKVSTTGIKRQNQELKRPEIPTLPINQKPVELARLGGGFSLMQPESARANASFREPERPGYQTAQTARVVPKLPLDRTTNGHSQLSARRRKIDSGLSSARSTSSTASKASSSFSQSSRSKTSSSSSKSSISSSSTSTSSNSSKKKSTGISSQSSKSKFSSSSVSSARSTKSSSSKSSSLSTHIITLNGDDEVPLSARVCGRRSAIEDLPERPLSSRRATKGGGAKTSRTKAQDWMPQTSPSRRLLMGENNDDLDFSLQGRGVQNVDLNPRPNSSRSTKDRRK